MTIKEKLCKSLGFQVLFLYVIGILVYNTSIYAENEEDWMPDPALRKAVREKLSIPANSPLTQAYMREHLTNLEARDKGIVNLTGLELATDLRVLGLSRNKISDLSPLSSLTGLGYLVLDDNQISDLSPLAGLVNLEVLRLRRNQITDVSPLAGLVNLKVLSVSHNQISDLSPLAGLPNLENLWTQGNLDKEFPSTLPLSDAQEAHWMPDPALRKAVRERMGIPPNRPLTQADLQEHLVDLHVHDRGIVNLTGLEHATDLQSLGLVRNNIQDLSPLSGLTGLGYLNLGSNQISDLRPLTALTRLEFLHLSGNQIKDISPLAGLVNLKNLNLSGNQIADISALAGLVNLENFDIRRNEARVLTTIPLSKLPQFGYDETCDLAGVPISERIENREYPSIFSAWGNIINLPSLSFRERLAYHDVHWSSLLFHMQWLPTPERVKTFLHVESAKEDRDDMLSLNPNMLFIVPLKYSSAEDWQYPEDWPYWLRDESGNRVVASVDGDGAAIYIDHTLPEVQDLVVRQAVGFAKCGLFDGIFIDTWREDELHDLWKVHYYAHDYLEASLTLLRRIREEVDEVRDDFLIIVNSNDAKVPRSAPYVNGMYLETVGPYTHQHLAKIESTLLWGEQHLREPQINSLEGWGIPSEHFNSEKNQQRMRLFTTLSLTHSDGYVRLFRGISNLTPHTHFYDHRDLIEKKHSEVHERGEPHSHPSLYWYSFYDADLGSPVGGDETKGQIYDNREGLFIREFTNGWAVYNRSGKEQTITLPMETTGVASGITAKQHTVPDLDGEMYLKHGTGTSADVNGDGVVNVLDLVLVAQHLGETAPSNSKVDVNGDGIVNILDLILIAQHLGGEMAAAPAMVSGTPNAAVIQAWIEQAQLENDGSIAFQRGIANLQRLLASLIPEKTVLLANYPNPFNPETWIPYHLANPSNVQITIYDTRGSIIQRLELGHQHPGYYATKNRAAYWDGRNEVGERVANGIYFYQLQADQVSFLRKMVMLK